MELGAYRILQTDRPKTIFAHACEDDGGRAVVAAHNLSDKPETVAVDLWKDDFDHFVYLFEEQGNEPISDGKINLKLPAHGYSWLRLAPK